MHHYKMHILWWVVRWFGVVGSSGTIFFNANKHQFPRASASTSAIPYICFLLKKTWFQCLKTIDSPLSEQ